MRGAQCAGMAGAWVPTEHEVPHRDWRRACCSAERKGVALVYERVARESGLQSSQWVERCNAQVRDALLLLERERAAVSSPWLLGDDCAHGGRKKQNERGKHRQQEAELPLRRIGQVRLPIDEAPDQVDAADSGDDGIGPVRAGDQQGR